MKPSISIVIALLLASAVFVRGQPATGKLAFLTVGKSYQVGFATQSAVGDAFVQYGGPLPNGSIVKIVKHEDSNWCLVERFFPVGVDEKTKKNRLRKEQFWLNFSNLLTVCEASPEQVSTANVIIE